MSRNKLIIGGIVVLALIIAIFSYLSFSLNKERVSQTPKGAEGVAEEPDKEVLTIAGKILDVNIRENFLVLQEDRTGEKFKVIVGENTSFIHLATPSDIEEGTSFTFKEEAIKLGDLKVGRQAFISSSHSIKAGKDIINPIEVKMLP